MGRLVSRWWADTVEARTEVDVVHRSAYRSEEYPQTLGPIDIVDLTGFPGDPAISDHIAAQRGAATHARFLSKFDDHAHNESYQRILRVA